MDEFLRWFEALLALEYEKSKASLDGSPMDTLKDLSRQGFARFLSDAETPEGLTWTRPPAPSIWSFARREGRTPVTR